MDVTEKHTENQGAKSPRSNRQWIVTFLDIFRRPIVSNANYLLGGNILNALGGFVFWAVVSRYQSPSNIGLGSAALAAVGLLSGIANLGLGYGILRFLPQSKTPKIFLNSIFIFSILSSMLIALVYLGGIRLWTANLLFLTNNLAYITGFVFLVAITTLGANLQSTFLARRLALYSLIYALLTNALKVVGGITLTFPGPISILGATALSTLVSVCIAYLLFLPKVEPTHRNGFQVSFLEVVRILPYSIGNYVSFLLELNIQTFVLFIILGVLGPAASGYAAIAWFMASMVMSPGLSWASSAFAESSNNLDNAKKIFIRASFPALGLTLLAALVVGIGAPLWLSFFGESYAIAASSFLRVMAIAAPLVVLANLFFYFLRVKKKIKLLLFLDILQAVLILVITGLFLSKYGIVAVGISYLVAYGIIAVLLGLGTIFFHRQQSQSS